MSRKSGKAQLAEIDDIELLRKAALLLQEDNKKLTKLLAQLKRKLHQLESGDPEQLKLQIAGLEQQLAQRNHLLWRQERKAQQRRRGEGREAHADRARQARPAAVAGDRAGPPRAEDRRH